MTTTEADAATDASGTRRFPLITDEALAALSERIGKPVSRPVPHITEVTRDSIRHWALGIGDDNPLWLDEEYARNSPAQAITAPGSMLYAFDRIVSGYVGGLPGIHAMFAGTDWQWHLPVRLGERYEVAATLKELRPLTSNFSGKSIKQTYTVTFRDSAGALVCEADSWCIRTQRDTARERATRATDEIKVWSPDEIAEIAGQYEAYRRRGAEPRYWDDVRVGDELPVLLKGPSTVTGFVCFTQGWGSLYVKAHGQAFDMFRQHPALGIPNAQGVPEPPERVHWDSDLARAVGVPAAYDYGPERVSWLGHLMTDWVGDDGFVKRLNVQVRKHNLVGDLTSCTGTVARVWEEGGEPLVEVDVRATNQRDEVSALGTSIARLPRKASA
jgi:acyl dehydratase